MPWSSSAPRCRRRSGSRPSAPSAPSWSRPPSWAPPSSSSPPPWPWRSWAGPSPARTLGRLADRLPLIGVGWPARLEGLRVDTVGLLGRRGAVLAAFAVGRLVTALPLTPGGLGVMEVGLVGALAAVGDASDAAVVAAVLLFRFLSFALPLPLGALGWLWWTARRGQARDRATDAQVRAGR